MEHLRAKRQKKEPERWPEPPADIDKDLWSMISLRCPDGQVIRRRWMRATTKLYQLLEFFHNYKKTFTGDYQLLTLYDEEVISTKENMQQTLDELDLMHEETFHIKTRPKPIWTTYKRASGNTEVTS